MIRKFVGAMLVVLAGASMYLSWGALYDLAIAAGMQPHRAIVFPFVIDLVTVVAMLIAIVDNSEKPSLRVYPWIALVIFGGATVAGNAIHVSLTSRDTDIDEYVAVIVNALPAVALLLTTHLAVVTIFRKGRHPRVYVYREAEGIASAHEPSTEEVAVLQAIPPLMVEVDPKERVLLLHGEGKSYRAIQEATGVSKSTAARMVAQASAEGSS